MTLSKKQYGVLLILWTVITLILLLMPASSFSNAQKLFNIPNADKIAHSILFGVQSFFLYKNLELSNKQFRTNMYILCTVIIFLFGLSTEIMQGLMYNTAKRRFSLADLLFDTLACIIVMAIIWLLNNKKSTKNIK